MQLISDPRAVAPEWLTAVLRAHDPLAPAVVSIRSEPIGTGQVGRCVRFHCEYTEQAAGRLPRTLVGKFPSDDPRSLAAARDHRTYVHEVGFYRELQPTVAVRTPRCWFHGIDVDGMRFALILEDLRHARPGDQLAGCSVEQAAAALTELAALHAPRWGDRRLAGVAWLEGPSAERARATAELYRAVLPGFLDRFGPRLEARAAALVERLADPLDRELARDVDPPAIVHRDFRVDNLLFGDGVSAPRVTVVDWQTVGRGPAAGDVAYLLGASLPIAQRRAHERELLRHYLSELRARGVRGLGEEWLLTEYRRHAIAGIVMAVVASMIVEVTERGDEMFLAMARRHCAHALDAEVDRWWQR